jgi:hypothetical protein
MTTRETFLQTSAGGPAGASDADEMARRGGTAMGRLGIQA